MANEQTITLTDFSPGLLTNADARALPPGGAQVCRDVDTDRGDLRVRAGRGPAVRCPMKAEAGVRALQEFYVAGHDPEFRFVGVIADRICWSVNGSTAAFWTADEPVGAYTVRRPKTPNGRVYHCCPIGDGPDYITDSTEPPWSTVIGSETPDSASVKWICDDDETFAEIDSAFTVSEAYPVRLAQYGDKLYLVDGVNLVRQLDADGHLLALESFDAPDVAPAITSDTSDYTFDAADNNVSRNESNLNTGHHISGDNMVRSGTEAQGYWYTSEGISGTPHWNDGYRLNTLWRAVEWQEHYPASHDVQAFTARTVFNGRYSSASETPNRSLCLDVTAWNNDTTPLNCGDIGVVRKYDQVVDLSDATAILFSFYVHADQEGTNLPDAMEIFWSEEADLANRDTWSYITVPLDDAAAGAWNDVTVDISDISNDQKNAIRWFGVRFTGLELSPVERFDAEGCWPAYPLGVQIIFSPFKANISKSKFVQGEYMFTYTYLRTIDGVEEESSEFIDPTDLQHPYPTLSINAAIPQNVIITCTLDPDSDATGINAYARGGTSGEFRLIGSRGFDVGKTTTDIKWNGTYDLTAAFLPEYIGKPPAGATMLCTHRNRMVYVAGLPTSKWKAGVSIKEGDIIRPNNANGYEFYCMQTGKTGGSVPAWVLTPGQLTTDDGGVIWRCQDPGPRDVLYFSNFGDPTRVPIMPSALQQVPATYGGWADLERWGHDVTGIAPYGPVLIAMKRQGIWACQGDPGDNSFRIDELDRREGCLSPESIAQVEGKLIWQARDKILTLDGTTVTDISQPIAPTVRAYAMTRQAAAFGIYDPQTRRYLLVYPVDDPEPYTEPAADALVLQLKTSSWTQYTTQPGGCGLHSQHAATPGVYLADVYGTGGAGTLFRLAPDATTDARNDGTTAPIHWEWISGELPSPFAGNYAQIYSVRGHVLVFSPTGAYTLAARLYPNNNRDDAHPAEHGYARTLTLTRLSHYGTGGSGVAQWTPPPRGEIESFALKLERADSDLVAVRSINITCLPRLVVRGRSAARGGYTV